jgi:hypothetical protein
MEATFSKTKEGKVIFTLLSHEGDEREIWDFEDPEELEKALQKFEEYINSNYTAIILDESGNSEGAIKKDEWDKLDSEHRRQFFDKPKEVVFIPLQFGG